MRRERRHQTYLIVHKGGTTVAYLALVLLTVRFFRGRLEWDFTAGALLLSLFWLCLCRLKLSHWLQTYFDVFSRLEITIPCSVGLLLSGLGIFLPGPPELRMVAAMELSAWIMLYVMYRQNRRHFEILGHGPVPEGTWINPPAGLLRPGDLLLTSGRVAVQLHESVGHAATVVQIEDGEMMVLSSHMDRGCTLEPLEAMASEQMRDGYYITMRLKQNLSPAEIARMGRTAQQMVLENQLWKYKRNRDRQRLITSLPMPQQWKDRLIKATRASGYDWFGTFMGRLAPHHWTCIGASEELYRRMGIETAPYGTGLLGFGTTLFDPIMPVRFLTDPAFRLLRVEDERLLEPVAPAGLR